MNVTELEISRYTLETKKIPARSLFAQENISHATNLAWVAGGIVSVRD